MSSENGGKESLAPNRKSMGGNPHDGSRSTHRRRYLRTYQRSWVARRRAEYLAGKSCAWCGSTERLEVDHIDPGQKLDHRVWSWSDDRRAAELAKCRVLCQRCHVERTVADRFGEVTHGTPRCFRRGCGRAECRAAFVRKYGARAAETQGRTWRHLPLAPEVSR